MKINNFRTVLPVILLLLLTMLCISCEEKATPEVVSISCEDKGTPEVVIDIDGYRAKTVELCESELTGPGYVILILNNDHSLHSVRIELPAVASDGTIHGAADSEFDIADGKVLTFPLYETDHLESIKHLDAIRILKGIYGVYLLYEDGTSEYVGGIAEEQLHRNDLLDTEQFNVDILWDKYGIDIGKIKNSAVTKEYEKQYHP